MGREGQYRVRDTGHPWQTDSRERDSTRVILMMMMIMLMILFCARIAKVISAHDIGGPVSRVTRNTPLKSTPS